MKQRPKCFQITITLWVILNHVINCVLFSTNKCFTPPISFQQLIIIIRCTFSIIGKDEWWIPRIQIFAFRVQHLPGWLTSVPLPSQAVWAAVGLLHRARCSGIRLLSHHIHDDSCPSWHSGARPAYRGVEPQACMAVRDVLSASFSAYCSVPCIPLQSPGRCIDTAPLRVLVRGPNAWRSMREQLSVILSYINPPLYIKWMERGFTIMDRVRETGLLNMTQYRCVLFWFFSVLFPWDPPDNAHKTSFNALLCLLEIHK